LINPLRFEGNIQAGAGWITQSDNYVNYYANNYTTLDYGYKVQQEQREEQRTAELAGDNSRHLKEIVGIGSDVLKSAISGTHQGPGLIGKAQKVLDKNPYGKVANVVIDGALSTFNVLKKENDIAEQRAAKDRAYTAQQEANQNAIQNKKNQPQAISGQETTFSKMT